MSDMQNILAALIAAIKERRITVDVAEAAVRMLDGVPDYCHMDAIKALLRTPSSDEEQPEDYLAVKTFTSTEFHIGDEIIEKHGLKGIYVGSDDENKISVVYELGGAESGWNKDKWHRTGRNFPAVQAILDELKKA